MCVIHLETSTKTSPKYRSPTFRAYQRLVGIRVQHVQHKRKPREIMGNKEHLTFVFPLWFSHDGPKSSKMSKKTFKIPSLLSASAGISSLALNSKCYYSPPTYTRLLSPSPYAYPCGHVLACRLCLHGLWARDPRVGHGYYNCINICLLVLQNSKLQNSEFQHYKK